MEFIIDNWYLLIAAAAVGAAAAIAVIKFVGQPTSVQLDKVRKWLLYTVTTAEKELGSGTGKLKLSKVYDAFLTKFPWLAKVISFAVFSELVDDALDEMRKILQSNEKAQQYVNGGAESEA